MKIAVDHRVCTGHGRCFTVAPELFEPDTDGRAALRCVEVPEELREKAIIAILSCPEEAISADEHGQLPPPASSRRQV